MLKLNTGGFDAGVKRAKGTLEGFADDVKSQFGARGLVGDIGEIIGGGGPIGGFKRLGNEIANMSREVQELHVRFRQGELNVSDYKKELLLMLPIVGDLGKAGISLGETFNAVFRDIKPEALVKLEHAERMKAGAAQAREFANEAQRLRVELAGLAAPKGARRELAQFDVRTSQERLKFHFDIIGAATKGAKMQGEITAQLFNQVAHQERLQLQAEAIKEAEEERLKIVKDLNDEFRFNNKALQEEAEALDRMRRDADKEKADTAKDILSRIERDREENFALGAAVEGGASAEAMRAVAAQLAGQRKPGGITDKDIHDAIERTRREANDRKELLRRIENKLDLLPVPVNLPK